MRELVIIIPDLYLAPREAGQTQTAAGVALPGLQQALRFGRKSALQGDWRSWLARWLRREDLASVAPARIVSGAPPASAAVVCDRNTTAWLATPLHLIASLTSLHLDPRSILQLSPDESAALAEDFNRTFADSPFRLEAVESGALLMRAHGVVDAATTEPARALAGELEASLPRGPDAGVLKRLGAELEMWLHSHPINDTRARRGEFPVNTLWLWGGSAATGRQELSTARSPSVPSARAPSVSVPPTSAPDIDSAPSDLFFGSDPYLTGLLRAHGAAAQPLPESLPDLGAYPAIQRAAFVAAVTPALHANPRWTLFEALADLDRRFLAPALAGLRHGTAAAVILIANDIQLRVERRDSLKFWRRSPRSALDELRSNVPPPMRGNLN